MSNVMEAGAGELTKEECRQSKCARKEGKEALHPSPTSCESDKSANYRSQTAASDCFSVCSTKLATSPTSVLGKAQRRRWL